MTPLHVTNGDIVVDHLRRAGLATDALAWADVLHEGPVPAGLDDAGLRRVRAEFLAGADGDDPEAVRRRFEDRDRALAGGRDGGYLLWFEADLYDQLQIAQILAALRDLEVAPDRARLVCIGEYPGIAHFGGLGELEPGVFPGLLEAATSLTAEALDPRRPLPDRAAPPGRDPGGCRGQRRGGLRPAGGAGGAAVPGRPVLLPDPGPAGQGPGAAGRARPGGRGGDRRHPRAPHRGRRVGAAG